MLLMAMLASAPAYGRLVRGDPMPHVLVVAVIAAFFSIFISPVIPESWGVFAILLNTGVFIALFFAGHLIGRRLDRDKYADYGDDE